MRGVTVMGIGREVPGAAGMLGRGKVMREEGGVLLGRGGKVSGEAGVFGRASLGGIGPE